MKPAQSFPLLVVATGLFFSSCSVQKQISRSADEKILRTPALETAHIGISIFEPATNKYWFNYQGDKYFVPASNTKIPTCYAAMKYLGDSLVGAVVDEKDGHVYLYGAGDPTFLHPEFSYQPVFSYLQSKKDEKIFLLRKCVAHSQRPVPVYGSGWSWNDYDEAYMAERNFFPIYGNVAKFSIENGELRVVPNYFKRNLSHSEKAGAPLSVSREMEQNRFIATGSQPTKTPVVIPFKTDGDVNLANAKYVVNTVDSLLSDTLGVKVMYSETMLALDDFQKIYSQPVDSVLKPMMHRSDNFFAEQTLLMVSHARLGYLDDAHIIDTILKTDFRDLPQRPRWADGSGLSRYNLFTPQDFVAILGKMKNEFGMERIKTIFPTGGKGTISSYYKSDSNYIFAKTGTLSGVVALSGFLYTKKNKLLVFSVLVNNHQSSATDIRRAVEQFIQGIREKY